MNGMDEWQAIQNEKMRLMETIEGGIAEKNAEIARLREALKFARKRLQYYGTISDRRHFDHDLAEVYPRIDAALSNGDR